MKTDLVLLDFWAPGCAPCHVLSKELEELAKEWGEILKIEKINTDEDVEKACEYMIRGLPTVVLLLEGQEQARWTGQASSEEIDEALRQIIDLRA